MDICNRESKKYRAISPHLKNDWIAIPSRPKSGTFLVTSIQDRRWFLILVRNRFLRATDFAYLYAFFRSVVCRLYVCHIRAPA